MQQVAHHDVGEGFAPLGRVPAFGVEHRCDGRSLVAVGVQRLDALHQGRKGAELGVAPDGSPQGVLSMKTAGPVAVHRDRLRRAGYGHHDLVQQEAGDGLAVGIRRRGRPPQGGNVVGQAPDRLALRRAQRHRLLGEEAVVIGLDPDFRRQSLLPRAFQSAGDQAVLGLDRAILTSRPIRFVMGALHSLTPLAMEVLAFQFQVLRPLQADLQRRRFESPQDQRANQRLQFTPAQRLAGRGGVAHQTRWPPENSAQYTSSRH
ncbi:hypothetical protein [Azospirillum doebereinerae]